MEELSRQEDSSSSADETSCLYHLNETPPKEEELAPFDYAAAITGTDESVEFKHDFRNRYGDNPEVIDQMQWRTSNDAFGGEKLYSGYVGPSKDVLENSSTPLDLLLYFLPLSFWENIAKATNARELQSREMRIRNSLNLQNSTPEETMREINSFIQIGPIEIIHYVGLLIARSVQPNMLGIKHHWDAKSVGVIPGGTFGSVMSLDRFLEISKYLHLSEDESLQTNDIGGLNYVADYLNGVFKKSWVLSPFINVKKSSLLPIRTHSGEKTYAKLNLLIDGIHKYCYSIDVSVGDFEEPCTSSIEANSETVFRLLSSCNVESMGKRIVMTDCSYTSIPLALKVYDMGFTFLGSIRRNKLRLDKELKEKTKQIQTSKDTTDDFNVYYSDDIRGLAYYQCLESPRTYILSLGVSTACESALQNEVTTNNFSPTGAALLQSQFSKNTSQASSTKYSIQEAAEHLQNNKSIFLGLLDVAFSNIHAIRNWKLRHDNFPYLSKGSFLMTLQEQILRYTEVEYDSCHGNIKQSIGGTENLSLHVPCQSRDMHPSGKRRYRICRVCKFLNKSNTRKETIWYCEQCSSSDSSMQKIFLCNMVRRTETGNTLTCFQAWHTLYKCGTALGLGWSRKKNKNMEMKSRISKRKRNEDHDDRRCSIEQVKESSFNDISQTTIADKEVSTTHIVEENVETGDESYCKLKGSECEESILENIDKNS